MGSGFTGPVGWFYKLQENGRFHGRHRHHRLTLGRHVCAAGDFKSFSEFHKLYFRRRQRMGHANWETTSSDEIRRGV